MGQSTTKFDQPEANIAKLDNQEVVNNILKGTFSLDLDRDVRGTFQTDVPSLNSLFNAKSTSFSHWKITFTGEYMNGREFVTSFESSLPTSRPIFNFVDGQIEFSPQDNGLVALTGKVLDSNVLLELLYWEIDGKKCFFNFYIVFNTKMRIKLFMSNLKEMITQKRTMIEYKSIIRTGKIILD